MILKFDYCLDKFFIFLYFTTICLNFAIFEILVPKQKFNHLINLNYQIDSSY